MPRAIGCICYGFPLPDFDGNYFEVSERWARERLPAQPVDRSDYTTPEWRRWFRASLGWQKTCENIRIMRCGADQCEILHVHADALLVEVEWEEYRPLRGFDFGPRPDADVFLREFCERFEIPWQEPGWYLAARYF